MIMLENLFELLGKSIESNEIIALFKEWNVAYPTKTTCTPNNDSVKTKMKKEGVLLYFTRGGNSKYLKPIPAKKSNSYIGLFSMIEITDTCKLTLPFGISHQLNPEALTTILGEPKVTHFMGETTIWRKNFNDKQELVVTHNLYSDGSRINTIAISFNYEPDLNTLEDYINAGF
jgi:hypothetical protein